MRLFKLMKLTHGLVLSVFLLSLASSSSAQVLCAPKTVKVASNGTVSIAGNLVVAATCPRNFVSVFDMSTFQGNKGDKGDIGPVGPLGPRGDTGPTGMVGPKGDKGATGAQGPKGDKGATGSQGAQGPKGDKGDTGATGSQGIQGAKGDKGDTGAKGDKGDDGGQGPQGPAGGQLPWMQVASDTQMDANTGYIVTGTGTVELTLPTDIAVGDVVEIRSEGSGFWRVVPAEDGQVIKGEEGLYTAGIKNWKKIVSSDDGAKLMAVPEIGYIYTSTDGGATWTERTGAGTKSWHSIASSSDGMRLAATTSDAIYTSANGGATWTEHIGGGRGAIASSSDGLRLASAPEEAYISTSTDGGETWTEQTASSQGEWAEIVSSSDGLRLAAHTFEGYISTSTDGGETWTEQTAAGERAWRGIASSADGLRLAAVPDEGHILTSTDGGETWTEQLASSSHKRWTSQGEPIASSADGLTLFLNIIGVGVGSGVYRSMDGGITWERFLKGNFEDIATNGSGSTLFAQHATSEGTVLFSSALNTWDGMPGDRHLRLIYLGDGVFGRS